MKTRKIFILATLALHAPCIKSQNLSDDNIRQFLTRFIRQYPQASLQDIYKGAFQDRFGPAHILTDRNAVEAYIKSELEEIGKEALADVRNSDVSHSTKSSLSLWDYCQPCGWHANFYRVDLAIIKDGVMPMDVFVDAFMESANGIDTTLTSAWVEEWDNTLMRPFPIWRVSQPIPHPLPNFCQVGNTWFIIVTASTRSIVLITASSARTCWNVLRRIVN